MSPSLSRFIPLPPCQCPWPLEVLAVVLDYAPRSTLAQCARINSAWYEPAVRRLYDHYDLFPTVNGHTNAAHLTERKLSYLKRTRHLTVWSHDARLCHSETPPPLPSLRTLTVPTGTRLLHYGDRPFGRRPCPLLRDLNPSTIILHGTDFPVTAPEIWGLLGGRDVIVAYDPTKSLAEFHVIDRWPTIINPEGAPRSLTVIFTPKHDEYIPEERYRYTNLSLLSSWVAMLPVDRRLTIVDVGAGATQEGLATSVTEVAWPLSKAWEEGGRDGFLRCVEERFLNYVREAIEAEAGVEGGIRDVDVEARIGNIAFVGREEFMATRLGGEVFAE